MLRYNYGWCHGPSGDAPAFRRLSAVGAQRGQAGVPSADVVHEFMGADSVDRDALARLVASIQIDDTA